MNFLIVTANDAIMTNRSE